MALLITCTITVVGVPVSAYAAHGKLDRNSFPNPDVPLRYMSKHRLSI